MLATNGGTVIRIRVHGQEGDTIRTAGRNTQGVTLFSIGKDEKVVSVGLIQEKDDDEEESEENAENIAPSMTSDNEAEAHDDINHDEPDQDNPSDEESEE
jgi:DNA gyrase subunit A